MKRTIAIFSGSLIVFCCALTISHAGGAGVDLYVNNYTKEERTNISMSDLKKDKNIASIDKLPSSLFHEKPWKSNISDRFIELPYVKEKTFDLLDDAYKGFSNAWLFSNYEPPGVQGKYKRGLRFTYGINGVNISVGNHLKTSIGYPSAYYYGYENILSVDSEYIHWDSRTPQLYITYNNSNIPKNYLYEINKLARSINSKFSGHGTIYDDTEVNYVGWARYIAEVAYDSVAMFIGSYDYVIKRRVMGHGNIWNHISATSDDKLWPDFAKTEHSIVEQQYEKKGKAYLSSHPISVYNTEKWEIPNQNIISWNKKGGQGITGYYGNSISNALGLYTIAWQALLETEDGENTKKAKEIWEWFNTSGVISGNMIRDGIYYDEYGRDTRLDPNHFDYYYGLYFLGSYYLYEKTKDKKYLDSAEHFVFVQTQGEYQRPFAGSQQDSALYPGLRSYFLARYLRMNPNTENKENIINYLIRNADKVLSSESDQLPGFENSIPARISALMILTSAAYAQQIKNESISMPINQ